MATSLATTTSLGTAPIAVTCDASGAFKGADVKCVAYPRAIFVTATNPVAASGVYMYKAASGAGGAGGWWKDDAYGGYKILPYPPDPDNNNTTRYGLLDATDVALFVITRTDAGSGLVATASAGSTATGTAKFECHGPAATAECTASFSCPLPCVFVSTATRTTATYTVIAATGAATATTIEMYKQPDGSVWVGGKRDGPTYVASASAASFTVTTGGVATTYTATRAGAAALTAPTASTASPAAGSYVLTGGAATTGSRTVRFEPTDPFWSGGGVTGPASVDARGAGDPGVPMEGKPGLSTAAIIGIVFGCIAAFLIAFGLFVLYKRRPGGAHGSRLS
jgi:hypothetical protein